MSRSAVYSLMLAVLLVGTLQLNVGAASAQITGSSCYTFNSNLKIGARGAEISALQQALRKDGQTVNESGTFDELTASAVSGFQAKYASEVLWPVGLKNSTGYVGPSTRAKLNQLYGCSAYSTPVPVTPSPTPVPGCGPGALFNSQTGQSCSVGVIPGCTGGALYSSLTGARCVNDGRYVQIWSPRSGETWDQDTEQKVSWTSSGLKSTDRYTFRLVDVNGRQCQVGEGRATDGQASIYPSSAGCGDNSDNRPRVGQKYTILLTIIDESGSKVFSTTGGPVLIASKSSSVPGCAYGAQYSSLTGASCSSGAPSLMVTYPNGGERLGPIGAKDVDLRVNWTSSNLTDPVDIYLQQDGVEMCLVARGVSVKLGTYPIVLDGYKCPGSNRTIGPGQYKIWMNTSNGVMGSGTALGHYDGSDNYFTIAAVADVRPTISFRASPSEISLGQQATLSWTTDNAQRCVLQYGSTEETVPVNGSKAVSPSQTTPYKLWCANDDGTGKDGPSADKTVTVNLSTAAPSCTLTTNKSSYRLGETVTFNWSSQNATYASFKQYNDGKDHQYVAGDKLDVSGAYSTPTNVYGNPTVTMLIYNYSGSSSCSTTFSVQ